MKIKDGFVLREIAGQTVVIATGEASKTFHGMVKLNGTGRDIWQGLAKGLSEEEIARGLVEKYEGVDLAKALEDTTRLIGKMEEAGFLA
jgi:hypothetical protein